VKASSVFTGLFYITWCCCECAFQIWSTTKTAF